MPEQTLSLQRGSRARRSPDAGTSTVGAPRAPEEEAPRRGNASAGNPCPERWDQESGSESALFWGLAVPPATAGFTAGIADNRLQASANITLMEIAEANGSKRVCSII